MTRDVREDASDAELLTAFADGVAELSSDERRLIEAKLARDPEARAEHAAVRQVLGRLRALPPEGNEPDWTALERSIHQAVGTEVPRPWWRRWTWMIPATTCLTAALALVLVWRRPTATEPTILAPVPTERTAPAAPTAPTPTVVEATVALWLDGAQIDVDLSAADVLAVPDAAEVEEPDVVGLLPVTDLAWIDAMDDDALARAERWLATKPETSGTKETKGTKG